MHKSAVATQLYTQGNELFKKLTGESYVGYYHILNDGSIVTGNVPVAGFGEVLIPKSFMPTSTNGDLISEYSEDGYENEYSVVTIKNYKNDIDIVSEVDSLNAQPPVITMQPDVLFKKNTSNDYIPGTDILIDENRTIKAYRGKQIRLEFNFNSFDDFNNIKFEWFDSFDRLVSADPVLIVDTTNISEEETFYCIVTDSYGSDTTNEIIISVIDSESNPYIKSNLLSNGSGNNSTSDWETTGDSPEDVGKFLPSWQESSDPFITTAGGYGTYFYHKFTRGWDVLDNKNQWYPRPEIFDSVNQFNGSVLSEIKDNYFRAGVFTPILRNGSNVYSGITKTSTHIIDLTDIADLIDGKAYGLQGFKTTLFGWIGTRADQADYGSCEFEFLDANDDVIQTAADTSISSARMFDRTVNDYPRDSSYPSIDIKLLGGYYDTGSNFDYSGIIYDGNAGAIYSRYEIEQQVSGSIIRTAGPEVKTCILGRSTDMIDVPKKTRKIRVTKRYIHEGGIYDLVWNGDELNDAGIDYVSDLMFVGLNVRLYPILIDDDNNIIETGLDENGNSVIKGMDFLETIPSNSEQSVLATTAAAGQTLTAYLDSQEVRFDDIPVIKLSSTSTLSRVFEFKTRDSSNTYEQTLPVNELDGNWSMYLNDSAQYFIRNNWPDPASDDLYLQHKIYNGYPEGLGNISSNIAQLDGDPANGSLPESLLTVSPQFAGVIEIN